MTQTRSTWILAGLALALLPVRNAGAQCWGETAKVKPVDGTGGDNFAWAVAASGDTMVAGAKFDDDNGPASGSAYVFDRDQGGPGAWGQVTKLLASDGTNGANFGWAVAISGDTVVVGANSDHSMGFERGAAYVYERDLGGASAWGEVLRLVPSDLLSTTFFGHTVSIFGDTAVVGTLAADKVYVFERDLGGPGAWGEQTIVSFLPGFTFGSAVSVGADTLVCGEWLSSVSGLYSGAAHVYERNLGGPNNWGFVKRLLPSDPMADMGFGYSVSVEGDTMVIGVQYVLNPQNYHGAAYVFERDEGGTDNWGEVRKLTGSSTQISDEFGSSVSISQDTIVVGARLGSGPFPNAGAAYLFERDRGGPDAWSELQKLVASDAESRDHFGHSVSISGETIASGANLDDDNGGNAGAAYVFDGAPSPITVYCAAGTSFSGCTALISACGVPSASAPSGFNVSAVEVEGKKRGLFFWGANGRQANPWGNGTSSQCVVPPVIRGALLPETGTQGLCDGTHTYDLNARWTARPSQSPNAGTVAQAQFWFRDPFNTSNRKTSLSDAIEFLVNP